MEDRETNLLVCPECQLLKFYSKCCSCCKICDECCDVALTGGPECSFCASVCVCWWICHFDDQEDQARLAYKLDPKSMRNRSTRGMLRLGHVVFLPYGKEIVDAIPFIPRFK